MRNATLRYASIPASVLSAAAIWIACSGSGSAGTPSSDTVGISGLELEHVASPSACGTGTDLLPVVAATASGDGGNPASNAVDGSLTTRWECRGTGCWLTVDLGNVQQVNALDVSWYQGSQRVYPFTLSFSQDGQTFTAATSGKSTGSTSQFERYSFPSTSARYVRLTIGADPAAIREVRSMGALACPTDGGSTGGITDGGATGGTTDGGTTDGGSSGGSTDGGTTLPPPASGSVDPFGVTEIYPTKSGGETWFETDPTHDPRFDPQNTLTQNADGSYKMTSTQVRMEVFTSTGYQPSLITTYDRQTLASRGYMQSPNDWKNIEMTGYVKVNATSATDNFSWYSRGGRHSSGIECEGSSYKGGLTYDGRTRWEKESWHVYYDQTSYTTTTGSIMGRWVGFKAVMHNVTVNGQTAVNLQLWLNDNADKVTWTKVYDVTDSGQIGGNATYCGGNTDAMPITWGGPITTFRWDSATDVDFKWLSVREIE